MHLPTRYKVEFNGMQYRIMYQTIQRNIFGHLKSSKWKVYEYSFAMQEVKYYNKLESAIRTIKEIRVFNKALSKARRCTRKIKEAEKCNLWKKVWP